MKRKKLKIKYQNIVKLFLIISIIFIIPKLFSKDEDTLVNHADIKIDFIGKKIDELTEYTNKNQIVLEKKYEYSKDFDKDYVININKNNNVFEALVSLGKIDNNLYKEKAVNELGKVPIMMYHGIIDTDNNEYVGGNVDKNGYNRTSKAFREDLEFYYNNGYRMIRLIDYVNGIIDVPLGFSPLILTFDDGNKNNFNVLGRNEDGTLKIDPECAVGILEEFKKKHPDMNVTATFFVMYNIFNQNEYNQDILDWLIDNGYDIGNHTTTHPDFTKITTSKSQEVIGKMYQKLDDMIRDKYVKIIALPFGSPYKKTHENYKYILEGEYNGYKYETTAALRVGWEPELSPFNKDFDKTFLKRCRAYDNNGKEFDIEMVFKNLEKNRYISDGDKNTIVIKKENESNLNSEYKNVIFY